MMRLYILIILIFFSINVEASNKVYLVHGYAGTGKELYKIKKAIKHEGFVYENYRYQSVFKDVDSVSKELFHKIKQEGFDTISFVTYSMGSLIVRSLYSHILNDKSFPFIYRIVMIAPPNKGLPVAEYFKKHKLINRLAGPNMNNLSTDSLTGSSKYPIATSEVGLIMGSINKKKFFKIKLDGENDGFVLENSAKMGNEKDVFCVNASHVGLIFDTRVKTSVINFLKVGKFE